ncbi:MAG: DUF1499 domain-containing protein [Planctomycetaceae bacterium]
MRAFLWTLAAIIVAWLVVRLLIRANSPRAVDLGISDARLRDCPASPNCVCSQATDAGHQIAPFAFTNEPAAARERLKKAVAALSGARLVTDSDNYLHYEFTTPWMGYIDDVEFLIDPQASTIHCRSASRIGHSDLGTNRRRIEAIRSAFAP